MGGEDETKSSAIVPSNQALGARLETDSAVQRQSVGVNLVTFDGKSCTHEVAWPQGREAGSFEPPPKRPGPPAREYPFKIDPFQQVSVNALEAGHSVLVAAHTSAGKTVVAEYAFAMALRDKARVVYTSPLKALSNQKFRELKDLFGDVGLMTGDVTINPEASCLVMTTEILRNMLYRHSEVVQEVGLLVYDEIHYLRDKERGVVWEESIILAPKGARFAFLSATIPNAREFAQWVANVHGSPCHVVYTDYRPTPLQHYLFPSGGDGLYMVVDEKGTFRDDNFQKCIAQLNDADGAGGKGKGKGEKANAPGDEKDGPRADIFKIVKMIIERNYDPVIVFSFSKRECDNLAKGCLTLDLTTDDEKAAIQRVYDAAVDMLSQEDAKLPQVQHLINQLKRGIGVHHSGMLPLLKEVTEVLFQENLLKVLFATETFSTGLNMPAKTVVFTNVRKFDGGSSRWLRSGEYIQMSGRAGRRGLDDRGVVIMMIDTRLEPAVAKEMIKGAPDTMVSEFHLGYNMLLNITRSQGMTPEAILKKSFKQFQVTQSLPQLRARVAALEAELQELDLGDKTAPVQQYMALLQLLVELRYQVRLYTSAPKAVLPFLQPGRLVRVLPQAYDPKAPLPEFSQLQSLQPADGAGPEEATGIGAGGAVSPGIWGCVVAFQRVGKKDLGAANGADGAGGKDDDDDDDGLGPSGSESDGGSGHSGRDSDSGGKGSKKRKSKGKKGKEEKGHKKKRAKHDDDEDSSSRAAAALRRARRVEQQMSKWIVDVLINCEEGWNPNIADSSGPGGKPRLRLLPAKAKGTPHVISIPLAQIDGISSVRVFIQKDLRPIEARQSSTKTVGEAVSRLLASHGRVPLLDAKEDLKIEGRGVRKPLSDLESVESALVKHSLAKDPELLQLLVAAQRITAVQEALQAARREVREGEGMIMTEELTARMRVLRRLGYLDKEGLVTQKGHVAAGIQAAHELVVCELIFGAGFKNMTPDRVAAICSCLVWTEKGDDRKPQLGDELASLQGILKQAARAVAKACIESKVPGVTDVEEFVEQFRGDLMPLVLDWSRGATFRSLVSDKRTTIFEGSLVRAVRRLEELLRQIAEALESIGNTDGCTLFTEAAARLRRDIVFAASLYL